MGWDKELLDGQKKAASYVGNHARLLAGPGTGKTFTLTRRASFLILEKCVQPEDILVVTFTRAAAFELRTRVKQELGIEKLPRISTLHSFALRQILRNSQRITALPEPLRIADDWEERHIVQEDLKEMLNLDRIEQVRELLQDLSADWQSLSAEEEDWEDRFPNPRFLGTWREHRQIYGYTLRSELVYRLKKELEQRGDFELEGDVKFFLVDEYQDLNRCDLAVVQSIASHETELFAAGDDDQSIYGFRKAHPEGIRRFNRDYPGAKELELETCMRCDRRILELGLFVAAQDPRRIEKKIHAAPKSGKGTVEILRFNTQSEEAQGITDLCSYLITQRNLAPKNILVLLRSDLRSVISRPIQEKLEGASIRVVSTTGTEDVMADARAFFALLRLSVRIEDSLAWRSVLRVWCSGVGPKSINVLYELARSRNESFAQTVVAARDNNEILPKEYRSRISNGIDQVFSQVINLFSVETEPYETCDQLIASVQSAAETIVKDKEKRERIMLLFKQASMEVEATTIQELIRAIEIGSGKIEQEIEEDSVRILTMHQAKGLTAKAVIVAAAEDEYIPGRNRDVKIDDERRLLYVSLTRAKHFLFVTYCDKRTGQQQHTGRNSGNDNRSLSQFLSDCPHIPKDGREFIGCLTAERNS